MKVSSEGEMKSGLFDPMTGEPYVLHRIEEATGAFVGQVREELKGWEEKVLSCCLEEPAEELPRRLVHHIYDHYGDSPEYLWENFPDYAVWRRKDTRTWYALMGKVERRKLGLEGKELVDILDVRMETGELDVLVDGKRYFRGWHMNKKHWCTVLLDGSMAFEELCALVEESFRLAKG